MLALQSPWYPQLRLRGPAPGDDEGELLCSSDFSWICIFDGLRFYNFFSRPARNFSRFGGEFFANSFVLALGFKEKCGKVKIFCVFRVFPLSWLKEWSKNCGVAEKCVFSRISLVLV